MAGPDYLATGHPGDLPQGTRPSRRQAPVRRRRREPLPGVRTDQSDRDLARLELRHRRHARVEDRIRAAKATGLANLPFDAWRRNAVWLELAWPPRT